MSIPAWEPDRGGENPDDWADDATADDWTEPDEWDADDSPITYPRELTPYEPEF